MKAPVFLQDGKRLLTSKGFETSQTWYHGTSSALLDSIQGTGLKRSGDKALNQAAKNTMATIGNHYVEYTEPVYLTQSKELAYYWAQQTVRDRSVRIEGEEFPIVLEVNLSEKQRNQIKPDVGAKSLLLMESGEKFMAHLAEVYENCGVEGPKISLMSANRMDFLSKLGMAYIDQDINVESIELLAD